MSARTDWIYHLTPEDIAEVERAMAPLIAREADIAQIAAMLVRRFQAEIAHDQQRRPVGGCRPADRRDEIGPHHQFGHAARGLVRRHAFGDDLATLFVVTSRYHMSEAELARQPLAGATLALSPGVRGLPEPCYAG